MAKTTDKREEVMAILKQAKKLVQRYRAFTGKPLGITGGLEELEAARLLGLELTIARTWLRRAAG